MSIQPDQTALLAYLREKDPTYFGKVFELRDAVKGWLAYIPQTFWHYTRHTVEHSDEIISQMSKLLFKEDHPERPVIDLSAVEAYILIAAAYLHDAGMVTPEGEKATILASEAWKAWVTQGGGKKRWEEVQSLRNGHQPADESVRYFLADVQTRFLIGEFVRRTHASRAAAVIEQHHVAMGRFDFDDPMLRRTVAIICVGHGLRPHELDDRELYPDRCDIRGQRVNIRLLAILLRLGDLLDMSYDRACPLLLNAACPLPADSLAHWTKYQRIVRRLTAHDRVELVAECETLEEHRLWRDWCQWIVDEIGEARTLMARAVRHKEWEPPFASMTGDDPTIVIRPAEGATYRPFEWRFELDHEAVFQRLVYDVYDDPAVFIRELIQNALDANRCQMYADLVKGNIEPPEYPNKVDEEWLQRYPVRVRLDEKEMENELSGEIERRQVLTVEDCGIGMDSDVIQRYFLQVGRSYYTTDEFRRSFRFVPTSRFGLGFLSVFAVSDHVTVETYKPVSAAKDGPIRLVLTGPRNYLLIEQGERKSSGTRIEVLLREPLEPGALTEAVSGWCRRVEFPVIVDDLGAESIVEAERPEQFTYEIPDVTEEGVTFMVKAFPVDVAGIMGEFYVFVRVDELGESWVERGYAESSYPGKHPSAETPPMPNSLTCLHGISMGPSWPHAECFSMRLDYRGERYDEALARGRHGRHRHAMKETDETMWLYDTRGRTAMEPELVALWEEILREHVATTGHVEGDSGWIYLQQLIGEFPFSFWNSCPGTVRTYVNRQLEFVSLEEIQAMSVITTASPLSLSLREKKTRPLPAWDSGTPSLTSKDIGLLSRQFRKFVFLNRFSCNVRWLDNGYLAVDWHISERDVLFMRPSHPMSIAALPSKTVVGVVIHKTVDYIYNHCLLNEGHPFVQWLVHAKEACRAEAHGLKAKQFDRLIEQVYDVIRYGYKLNHLLDYVKGWRELPNLPPELVPPDIELTRGSFRLVPPGEEGK